MSLDTTQVNKLVDYFGSRWKLGLEGRTYLVKGNQPMHRDKAILADSIFLAIALASAGLSRAEAIETLRLVTWLVINHVNPDFNREHSMDEINFEDQMFLLDEYLKKSENLATALGYCTKLLYGITPDSPEHRKLVGTIMAAMGLSDVSEILRFVGEVVTGES